MIYKAYIVDCHFCGCHQIFTQSKTIDEVERNLKKWGWVKIGDHHFCNNECKKNYIDDEKQLQKHRK